MDGLRGEYRIENHPGAKSVRRAAGVLQQRPSQEQGPQLQAHVRTQGGFFHLMRSIRILIWQILQHFP